MGGADDPRPPMSSGMLLARRRATMRVEPVFDQREYALAPVVHGDHVAGALDPHHLLLTRTEPGKRPLGVRHRDAVVFA